MNSTNLSRLQKTENPGIIYNILYIIYNAGLDSFRSRIKESVARKRLSFAFAFAFTVLFSFVFYRSIMTTTRQNLLVVWLDNSRSTGVTDLPATIEGEKDK
jgi:hypothetical protein